MLQVWLGLPILERKRTPSSQPRSKRELDFKSVSGRPMKRLEVEFEAYAKSHSYDSPLVVVVIFFFPTSSYSRPSDTIP
ncbi:hypothetical protein M405DRAFT_809114 [Rhizopogon salebrosus TDB-379]|nr:hypothetical protein M405DRAFT_809114 [Rhizopogon salebrosus TDB-379]